MNPVQDFDPASIEERILRAVDLFIGTDAYLLAYNVNERSITHKFAEQLQADFPEWDVDCEYNRDQHDKKELKLPSRNNISNTDPDARTVFPDIILHKRGTDLNFVVIEVKKSSNPEPDEWDKVKLTAFKEQLRYKLALFIRFHTDSDFHTGTTENNFKYEAV